MLEAAIEQASQAIGEGRDAVQGLRLSTLENNELAVSIRTMGEEFASAESNETTTPFRVLVEGTPRTLQPIVRDEVYRLAAEKLTIRSELSRGTEVDLVIPASTAYVNSTTPA